MHPLLEPAAAPQDTLYTDVLAGLQKRPATIPSKYLYDRRGAMLFSQICDLEEYYPTRTELALTHRHAEDLANRLGARRVLAELGTGDGRKTHILLRHLHDLAAFIPIDISAKQLQRSAHQLRQAFPCLEVMPLCVDYTSAWTLPDVGGDEGKVFYFPGSTIGNFDPHQARQFLRRLSVKAGAKGNLIIGVDLRKPRSVVEAAYNDSLGVTAAFNLNLLRRINRECHANFDLASFRHHALYQPEYGRIEMRLVSRCSQQVEFPTQTVEFSRGEFIVTEHSYKFRIEDFARLSEEAGWRTRAIWTDDDQLFSLWYLQSFTPRDE